MAADPLATKATELPYKAGVQRNDREKLAEGLNECLASTYVLYAKTHLYHWNVTGPLFYSVHKLTDDQYNDMAEAIDEIAERIRAIGFPVHPGLGKWIENSVVKDTSDTPTTRDMCRELAEDHQAVAAQMRELSEHAHEVGDLYTHELTTGRIGFHEEAAWMLNALLVKDA